ncbi:MAG: VOC family protein [Hydrogenophaga sp.]|jgi:catechol 2,3-dioxygenase-like lactoylglutathione lyase family enzyme|uniref:VOC family protein n=1 Tax=Hydrogenophaga sp. TaxID=1904254 RepID=UPI001DD502EE|nr:VOC family protein [Hydrogenophaga sp.]MBW0168933.1 VOC family protein [Hydrogenophaga sp.]MBW0184846.1 VOC family protein [Hydrogenophaga sp.]
MGISLNHFSIRTTDLAATRAFYVDLLGLQEGPRPEFPFPGYWLYQGPKEAFANAAVHVIGIDPNDRSGLEGYLGERNEASLKGSGAVDHVAFFATDLAGMLQRLRAAGVEPRERTVPGVGLHQLFLDDPSGVVVELNYPVAEKQALDRPPAP